MLSTTVLGWLAIRAILRGSGVSILTAGVVVGLGVEAKPQVGLVAAAMLATVLVVGPRSLVRSWWAVGGAGCAVVLAAPYVIWQQQHGWPQLTVAGNIAGSQEGGRAGFFTSNYGEAGAIDLLGRALRLPRAYSGHNGFSEWGIPRRSDTHVLLIGFNDAADAKPYFARCRTLATVNDRVGLNNNEQGLPVLLCRTTGPWPTLWPHLTHYD